MKPKAGISHDEAVIRELRKNRFSNRVGTAPLGCPSSAARPFVITRSAVPYGPGRQPSVCKVSGARPPALRIRSRGIRRHAGAFPSSNQRAGEGNSFCPDSGSEAGSFTASVPHVSQKRENPALSAVERSLPRAKSKGQPQSG